MPIAGGSGGTSATDWSYNRDVVGELDNSLPGWFADAFATDRGNMREQNEFNHVEAELQRQWESDEAVKAWNRQLEASNTSYQRAVEDMRRAGINPILAFQQGGASTPTSSAPAGSAASGSANGGMRMHLNPKRDSFLREALRLLAMFSATSGLQLALSLGSPALSAGKAVPQLISGHLTSGG